MIKLYLPLTRLPLSPSSRLHNSSANTLFQLIIMSAETVQENQARPKGFSSVEKWIIWAVFCLLVGLSSQFIVFPALLFISWGVARFRWYMGEKIVWQQRWPAVLVFVVGIGMMLWPILKDAL